MKSSKISLSTRTLKSSNSAKSGSYVQNNSSAFHQKIGSTFAVLHKANALIAKYSHTKKCDTEQEILDSLNNKIIMQKNKEFEDSSKKLQNITLEWDSEFSFESEREGLLKRSGLTTEKSLLEGKESSGNDDFTFKGGLIQWFSDDKDGSELLGASQPNSLNTSKDAEEENSLSFFGQQVHMFADDILESLNASEDVISFEKVVSKTLEEMSEGIESSLVSASNDSELNRANSRENKLGKKSEEINKKDINGSIEEELTNEVKKVIESSAQDIRQMALESTHHTSLDILNKPENNRKTKLCDKGVQTEKFVVSNKFTRKGSKSNCLEHVTNDSMLREHISADIHSSPFLTGSTNSKIVEKLITVQNAKAMNEIMRLQLHRSEQWFQIQRNLRENLLKSIESGEHYSYTTWKDTRKILKEGRQRRKKAPKQKSSELS